MSESMFSGSPGIPEGAFKRLNTDDLEKAVGFIIQNFITLEELVEESNEGAATRIEWATFDEDAVETEQSTLGTLSAEKISTGTYRVTSTISATGAPIVTPVSTATEEPSVSSAAYPWFTTTAARDEFSAHYDPVTGKLWATDYDHSAVAGVDRIAIGFPTSTVPEAYWYLPSGFTRMNANKGNVLHIDLTYRLAIVQCISNDSSILTTLFLDMDSLTVVGSMMHTYAGGSTGIVLAYSDDYFIVRTTGNELWSRDTDGLPDTLIATYSSAGGVGNIGAPHGFIEDNNGHFWFKNGASPNEWERYPNTGAAPSRHAIPGGTYALDDDLRAFLPSENATYFMDSAGDHLWKISHDSPYTITQVTSSPYAGYGGGNVATTLDACTCMVFTPDYSSLIFIRNGDVEPYLYFVDYTDGSIDSALPLPITFSTDNYNYDEVAVWGDYIATTGDRYLQVINYVRGTEGSNLAFTPPLFAARRSSLTEFIVEFWNPEALPQKVKMDCGFHIYLARDPT